MMTFAVGEKVVYPNQGVGTIENISTRYFEQRPEKFYLLRLFCSSMTVMVPFSNAETIGRVLYTNYVYYFQAAGLVLLVAMIGAIVLTLKHKPGVRRQVIADQVVRTPATGMRVVQIKSGEGIAP